MNRNRISDSVNVSANIFSLSRYSLGRFILHPFSFSSDNKFHLYSVLLSTRFSIFPNISNSPRKIFILNIEMKIYILTKSLILLFNKLFIIHYMYLMTVVRHRRFFFFKLSLHIQNKSIGTTLKSVDIDESPSIAVKERWEEK